MTKYRAYRFDENDHIVGMRIVEAATDAKAVEIAKPDANGHDVEVWDGPRKIARLSGPSVLARTSSSDVHEQVRPQ